MAAKKIQSLCSIIKETTTSILSGFTIQNGYAATYITGGLDMEFSSAPTITGNIIAANQGHLGGGIWGQGGAMIITNNVINENSAFGGTGGGIELDATYGGPQITAKVIESNTACIGGGGIELEGLQGPG